MTVMMYVVQKNASGGEPKWLSRAKPTPIWGDKRHALMFETRALAQMAAQMAGGIDNTIEIVFVADPGRWRAA